MFLIIRRLLHGEYFRELGQCGNLHIILYAEFFRHLIEIIHIFSCQLTVILKAHVALRIVLVVDEQVNLPPLDVFLKKGPDGSFKVIKLLWHLNTQVQISVIHGFHFDRNPIFIGYILAPAETSHAF